eukprot:TRINITY_DN1077_c0_g1_i2.p2 TRINITY_DN1077_c0_g1~~TRINITY_DN1077_c0_g1_i2.p2  ORF type:complete len:114 (-),score=26.94 TRINITY_DN1077_c0_g1_i2:87-428(-)
MELSEKLIDKLTSSQQDALTAMNLDQLKKRLQANDQVSTGTKGVLQTRVADCILNGNLPRCPKCSGGKVKQSSANAFYCPGYQDDDKFKTCRWKGTAADITRPPWQTADGEEI